MQSNEGFNQTKLLTTQQAAKLCGISERHFLTLDQRGELGPERVRLGSSVRWNHAELTDWMNRGCPKREQWSMIKSDRFHRPGRNTPSV